MSKSLERIGLHSDVPFKMSLSADGDISPTSSLVAVRQSIFNILNTIPGTRPLNPDFGCNLAAFLFEPFDDATANAIGERVKRSLGRHEPRIQLRKIRVIIDEEKQEYLINVFYRLVTVSVNDSVKVTLQRL
jgi:phage baseplate assembly protein W